MSSLYQCIKENLVTSYQSDRYLGTVTTTPRSAVNEELYDRCMMARGYRTSVVTLGRHQ